MSRYAESSGTATAPVAASVQPSVQPSAPPNTQPVTPATPATSATQSAQPATKPLSAKELKALKKMEKQAKRAAQKEASGLPPRSDIPSTTTPVSTPNINPVGGPAPPRQRKQAQEVADLPPVQRPITVSEALESRLPLFAHLEPSTSFTKALNANSSSGNLLHPSILQLYLQTATYKIIGSNARCKAMLQAFKEFISDYKTPPGTSLARNLTSQLSIQIDFLKNARQLSIPMGNSIRWLKQEISKVSIDISEQEAKDELIDSISNFIRDRLDIADQVIMQSAAQSINNGDVILTYACSHVVKQALIAAGKDGKKKFHVIVVDSRPLFEGKALVKELVSNNIQCTYVLINALPYVVKDVTTVFLGANAMFSNGQLYSRVGTAVVATLAQSHNIPVIVLCETIKFSDRAQLDSFAYNERAPADALLHNISIDPENNIIPSPIKDEITSDDPISIVNILYDLTPQTAIKKVITEVGSLPASSVPVILREYRAT